MKSKALITGGAGFIGSHLCDFLVEKGFYVICMDNLITGSVDNIRHLLKNKNFKFIQHDVTKYIRINGSIGYVLHFASPASPIDYLRYPIKTLKVGAIGTHNTLGFAKRKRAKFLLASTSEVYGDPLVHPQKENYYGNVNQIGPRGVYDEGKRFAEAITMAYHRKHKMDTRIARIFNSILADQTVVVFNDDELHLEEIGKYASRINRHINNSQILVPCFDPKTFKVDLKEVSTLIKHPYQGDAYELTLAYGRKIKITGDHSVFKRNKSGNPVAIPVRNLKVGDHVAIPAKLPVVEKDIAYINIVQEIIKKYPEDKLWDYAVHSAELTPLINERKQKIYKILFESRRYNAKRFNNGLFCAFNRYRHNSFLPLYVINRLGLNIPENAKIRIFSRGTHIYTPNKIKITDEILWLLGFYIAEGCGHYRSGKSYFISLSSDEHFLKRAALILEEGFGVHTIYRKSEKDKRSPSIFVHSKILYFIFDRMFKVTKSLSAGIEIPSWILQLPLSRLKYVLEGFREGDGTHSGNKIGNELCFDTTSKRLALQLSMLLLRFGIVASVGKYATTFKKKYGGKKFPFYRITVCEVSTFNILEWDKGVRQKLRASRKGDLVWAWIRKIEKCKSSLYVYDFSVPGAENFIAGNGVFCHNTFGPRMRQRDGRVIPNFMAQALKGNPLTVYGDGSQTRSFCYIDDLVKGIYKLMLSDFNQPVNLGNPDEITIFELAKKIIKLTKSKSKIIHEPLPMDDPKVRRPDITLAKSKLKWEPKVNFKKGLIKTLNAFSKSFS